MRRAARRAGLAASAVLALAAGCATAVPQPGAQAAPDPAATASAPAAPASPAVAPPGAELPDTIVLRQWLLLPPVDRRGRRPFRADAVFARHLLDPQAPPPAAGEAISGETGEAQHWEPREAEPDGTLSGDFAWGYACVTSPAPRVMLAELAGAGTLFVNGDGAAGDSYRSGFGLAPVALRAGDNHLYVTGVREGFRLVLRAPEHALLLEQADTTRPDLVGGAVGGGTGLEGELAVTVINASLAPIARLQAATGDDAPGSLFARVDARDDERPGLPPLGVLKLPLRFALREGVALPAAPGVVELPVTIGGHPDEPARTESVGLELRASDAARRLTRRSRIDDSVQEYAVRAPADPAADRAADRAAAPGLVLALHGAGVDALGHAASYAPKPDWWLVAPSNRRAFGFDWQDWGRLDAYETLDHALAWTGADPARVALTGHSMGGHGSWHLAVNDPDRFIAVAPSAGWSTFDSYPGRPDGALAALWHAADGAGDTPGLVANLAGRPVYVLHGDADDNVPVSEGRALHAALAAAAADARARGLPALDPQLHVQPGAGHWWDGDASPGADCVDWPPIFALFDAQPRRQPGTPAATRFEWTCVDPWIDRSHEWVAVIRPLEYGRPVHVRGAWDPAARRVELTTDNAALIVLHWPDGQPPAACTIDGDAIACGADWGTGTRADRDIGDVIERHEDGWRLWSIDVLQAEFRGWTMDGGPVMKSPARSGPFKRAFDNRFVLVAGTAGDDREDAELLARARYDSQVWRYRANGRAEVWSDVQVLSAGHLQRLSGRNLILYGNRDTNLAFVALVPPDCPLRAERGRIALGDAVWEGDDLAALCVYPRVGDPGALLGLFADSGPRGTRLGYTLSTFISGVGCPDFALFDSSVLVHGDGGVRAAGWFDSRWQQPPP